MGAFMSDDVCNFDESPLSLFGDQSNHSLDYVNTDNEVEGIISSKVSIELEKDKDNRSYFMSNLISATSVAQQWY